VIIGYYDYDERSQGFFEVFSRVLRGCGVPFLDLMTKMRVGALLMDVRE
jgi:hypothetical protein